MDAPEDVSELLPPRRPTGSPSRDQAVLDHVPSTQRSAALVTAGIILSRIFGLIRQRVSAHYFGTSAFADVLAAAFRVGNITQNLLGEGTLSASFIPIYVKLRAANRTREATHFALSAFGLLGLVAVAASLLGVLAAPWLSTAIAPGFDPVRLENTIQIVRIVFPMTGVLVLSAWGLGVLNAHRSFFLPYAAPVIWSLTQIVGLLVAGAVFNLEREALATCLALSALAGAVLQLAVLLPSAHTLLGSLRPRFDLADPNVRSAIRRLPGVLLGRGVIRISGLIDTMLVSFLGPGANAAFGYAQTVYLLPMSLLGVGEAAVALPEMASDSAEGDLVRRNALLRARLGASFSRLAVLSVPTTLGFFFLARELITLLLQSGRFDRAATERVEPLLAAYGFALLGNAGSRVLTTTSYAIGDTKTPARYAIYRVVASSAVALGLMQVLDVMGVVLGAVIAAWVEALALGLFIRRRIGGLGLRAIPAGRIVVLSVGAVGPAVFLRALLPGEFSATPMGATCVLGTAGAAFVLLAPKLGLLQLRTLFARR